MERLCKEVHVQTYLAFDTVIMFSDNQGATQLTKSNDEL